MTNNSSQRSAFIDTNVLAHIAGESKKGLDILRTLRDYDFEAVTFRKCVYELYSMGKGTTKDRGNRNHPLKTLFPVEINDIGQKLFKKEPDIDEVGNAFYWYNLCEEWNSSHNDMQEDFVIWKQGLKSGFSKIDTSLRKHSVTICEYTQVFASDWYRCYGFGYEQEFAQDSLLPNEDFELILAALYMKSRVFVTEDDKDLIWRGGLSLGFNTPRLSFCCPERLREAIEDDFNFRFYRRQSQM